MIVANFNGVPIFNPVLPLLCWLYDERIYFFRIDDDPERMEAAARRIAPFAAASFVVAVAVCFVDFAVVAPRALLLSLITLNIVFGSVITYRFVDKISMFKTVILSRDQYGRLDKSGRGPSTTLLLALIAIGYIASAAAAFRIVGQNILVRLPWLLVAFLALGLLAAIIKGGREIID